jgi:hypothetical protein
VNVVELHEVGDMGESVIRLLDVDRVVVELDEMFLFEDASTGRDEIEAVEAADFVVRRIDVVTFLDPKVLENETEWQGDVPAMIGRDELDSV